jgi:hypothetical protein
MGGGLVGAGDASGPELGEGAWVLPQPVTKKASIIKAKKISWVLFIFHSPSRNIPLFRRDMQIQYTYFIG